MPTACIVLSVLLSLAIVGAICAVLYLYMRFDGPGFPLWQEVVMASPCDRGYLIDKRIAPTHEDAATFLCVPRLYSTDAAGNLCTRIEVQDLHDSWLVVACFAHPHPISLMGPSHIA